MKQFLVGLAAVVFLAACGAGSSNGNQTVPDTVAADAAHDVAALETPPGVDTGTDVARVDTPPPGDGPRGDARLPETAADLPAPNDLAVPDAAPDLVAVDTATDVPMPTDTPVHPGDVPPPPADVPLLTDTPAHPGDVPPPPADVPLLTDTPAHPPDVPGAPDVPVTVSDAFRLEVASDALSADEVSSPPVPCVPPCDHNACQTCNGHGQCVATCDAAACEACDGAGACMSACDPAACEICATGACVVACDPSELCDAGACVPGGPRTCGAPAVLACGATLNGDSAGAPANRLANYSCVDYPENHPEDVYVLSTDAMNVTLHLTGMSADLDLFLLTAVCEESACTASSATAGDETLSFTAAAGTNYYVVVDSFFTDDTTYTLDAQCEPPCTPDCTTLECGPDPVCGRSCGSCGAGLQCQDGLCVQCVQDCSATQCGPDPVCGESCGVCHVGHTCWEGACISSAAEAEPNSDVATANAIPVPKYIYGTLADASDVDWYTFAFAPTGTLTIETAPGDFDTDTELWLYTEGGANEVAHDDDSGVDFFSKIVYVAPANQYWLKVACTARAGECVPGDYVLIVTRTN